MPIYDAWAETPPPPDPRLSPGEIVRALRPLLRPGRRGRIERALSQRLVSVTLVLENLHDPHNGAAALRTAEALGLLHVHVIAADGSFPFSRKVTQDAHKWLNIHLHSTVEGCLPRLRQAGFACWAATVPRLGSAPSGLALDVDRPLALVFGNEHEGLTEGAIAACDRRFHLPVFGFSESYNLSVAVAMALARATERRRELLGSAGDLPPEAAERLRAAYYARSTKHAVELLRNRLHGP